MNFYAVEQRESDIPVEVPTNDWKLDVGGGEGTGGKSCIYVYTYTGLYSVCWGEAKFPSLEKGRRKLLMGDVLPPSLSGM
jgi:hypothetical protein